MGDEESRKVREREGTLYTRYKGEGGKKRSKG